ncbi:hypothetical protein QCA50_018972 [Cerrena zonata]|uniref:Cytochrome P450 n=1 Tax=Cerrena zonata TaxID=2478898 RepID=A0AAW0FL01_9APHY
MDELMALPYLDMVVRETLRVHAPVPSTIRQAQEDEVIPVGEPYTDRHGEVRDEIRVLKGDVIVVPILSLNRSKEIWGPDAMEFNPERWETPPSGTEDIPGVWGHILSFLGGPRACIGYRFSVVEMKSLLFVLLRSFEFELAVDPASIQKKQGAVSRPFVSTEAEVGDQMPLFVRHYRRC